MTHDETEQGRSSRRWQYLLQRGALGWGLPAGILFATATWFAGLGHGGHPGVHFGVAVAVFMLGGLVYGEVMWRMRRRDGTVDASGD